MSYVYQPFPKMLYKPGDMTTVVPDQVALDKALAAGWALRPVAEAPEAPVVHDPSGWPLEGLSVPVPDSGIENAEVPVVLEPMPDPEPVKRGPGRPRKVR